MRVINHNWSATKQRPHPQSVAEISSHSVLSGDRIQQCETSHFRVAIINCYSKTSVSNIVYLLMSILLILMSTLTHFSLYQNSMVISSVLDCESVWTLTVDILNTICNRDCFADCSLDLTLIVSFQKISVLVSCWMQITISQSWNWTHLQFCTQCSNRCQCVLCNFLRFLFSIMS